MKHSINYRIGIILALVLVLTVSTVLVTLLSQEESLKIEKTKENIHELSSNINESIKCLMGEGVTDAKPLVAKLATSKNIVDLQLKHGDAIHTGALAMLDEDERKVLNSGETISKSEVFNSKEVYRTIEPVLAEKNCLQCHNAAEGSTLAVISLRYSMEKTNAFIASQRLKAVGMLVATIAIAFFVIMYFLRKYVIAILVASVEKIKELTGAIQEITGNMDLLAKGHLDVHMTLKVEKMPITNDDELGELVKHLNIIVDDVTSVANSFEKTKNEIAQLISETNILTAYAKEGKLDQRVDLTKYTGAYRDLLAGINLSFSEIAAPLQNSTSVLNELAKGDFTVSMQGQYKGVNLVMKNSINKLVDTMNQMLSEIRSSLNSTKSAANEISHMSEELVQDAHNQKAVIGEVAAAVDQMTKTVATTSQNISTVSSLAQSAVSDTQKGVATLHQSKSVMVDAKNLAEDAELVISSLLKRTEQIGAVTNMIQEIAEQTNLLALNAAIEAARAGENGRGFAIVADEVRKLADRTNSATREIDVTIKAIQEEADKSYNSMRKAGKSVADCMNLTEDLHVALQTVSSTVTIVNDEMNQLASSAEEQSATAVEICSSMESIAAVTDRFVVGTEEFEQTANALRGLTEHLNKSISHFSVLDTHEQPRHNLLK